MKNSIPYHIIAAPFQVYYAAVGADYPAVDEDPDGGTWTQLGASGSRDVDEDGVTVNAAQTTTKYRTLGSTGARKAFRGSEDMAVSFKIADLRAAAIVAALGGENAITTVAAGIGTPGTQSVGLSRGSVVGQVALLVRGPSPVMEDGILQFEIPRCFQSAPAQEIKATKTTPAMLSFVFDALEDEDAESEDERFGRVVAQTADALT